MSLGIAIGAAASALVSRHVVRVLVRRARAAERQARANERMAEIGAMTSGLTHEIKNPLSTIGLNAQLLAEGLSEIPTDQPCEPEVRARLVRRVDGLRREVERLRGILQDFLSYAGEVRVTPVPTDVAQLVGELADFFSPQAAQQRVQLRVDTPTEPLMAMVDAPMLKQAMLNLMLNAMQAFGPPDPAAAKPRELILRVHRIDAEVAKPRIAPAPSRESEVAIHVIDTGAGIPSEKLDKIFQPYYTTKAGGSGLGLAITRRIVEAHDGRIEVVSQIGQGTDFVITLRGS
jgi:signal transduction histidine kinase